MGATERLGVWLRSGAISRPQPLLIPRRVVTLALRAYPLWPLPPPPKPLEHSSGKESQRQVILTSMRGSSPVRRPLILPLAGPVKDCRPSLRLICPLAAPYL